MADDSSVKHCIESSEELLHKRCNQLRDIIFLNDDYDPVAIINIANDIKLVSEIIVAQANKLINQ